MTLPAGLSANDEAWTTKQVALFLGITRSKVPPTMARWGVRPLPEGVDTGRGGISKTYRPADVIEADDRRPRKRRTKGAAT